MQRTGLAMLAGAFEGWLNDAIDQMARIMPAIAKGVINQSKSVVRSLRAVRDGRRRSALPLSADVRMRCAEQPRAQVLAPWSNRWVEGSSASFLGKPLLFRGLKLLRHAESGLRSIDPARKFLK